MTTSPRISPEEFRYRYRDLAKRMIIARLNHDRAAREGALGEAITLAADLSGDLYVTTKHTGIALNALLDETLDAIARAAPARAPRTTP